MKNWAEQAKAAGAQPTGAVAHPSATVVLLREEAGALEALMLKRSSKLAFHGGAWVLPGGRVDDEDRVEGGDVLDAARRAAARETWEEVGLVVDPTALVHLSVWTTPEISPKRFVTWFFVAEVGEGTAEVDGVEAEEHRWYRPDDALAARAAGSIELAPPQFVTLLALRGLTVPDVLAHAAGSEPMDFRPRFHFLDGGVAMCVYTEDVAFDDVGLLDAPGPRHRLVMTDGEWVYERDH